MPAAASRSLVSLSPFIAQIQCYSSRHWMEAGLHLLLLPMSEPRSPQEYNASNMFSTPCFRVTALEGHPTQDPAS
jgi:hypothetical protein